MYWELPPDFKIYEALGAIADGRVELIFNPLLNLNEINTPRNNIIEVKQYSSSRQKFYTIKYNPETAEIMSNDNATWYIGYLGYPALSALLFIQKIKFDQNILPYFKDIIFKDVNQKYKNNFQKSKLEIDSVLANRGLDLKIFQDQCELIFEQLAALGLRPLGKKVRPLKVY